MASQRPILFINPTGRSRKGCLTCRSQRKKCDEVQPICTACKDRGIECSYPSKTIQTGARPTTQILPRDHEAPSSVIAKRPEVAASIGVQLPSFVEGQGVYHFRTHYSKLICFAQNGRLDPFQTLILPMVFESAIVRSAIEAAASAHLHVLGVVPSSEPIRLHSKALRDLSEALSKRDVAADTAMVVEQLATACLILIYYEQTLDLSAVTIRWHLVAAKKFLGDLWQRSWQTPRVDFLTKLFAYFDLMLAFSLRLKPLAEAQTFSSPQYPNFCPIFGYGSTLYPCLHSLACLLAQKHESTREGPRPNLEAVHDLEVNLLIWQPPSHPASTAATPSSSSGKDGNDWDYLKDYSSYERILQTALAFRSAALLVLYTELLPTSSSDISGSLHSSADAAECQYSRLLDHLLRLNTFTFAMPTRSSPPPEPTPMLDNANHANIGSHLSSLVSTEYAATASLSTTFTTITWPLHTAAVRAKSPGDRAVLSQIFERAYQKHRVRIVIAAKRHAEHIWQGGAGHSRVGKPRQLEEVGSPDSGREEEPDSSDFPLLV